MKRGGGLEEKDSYKTQKSSWKTMQPLLMYTFYALFGFSFHSVLFKMTNDMTEPDGAATESSSNRERVVRNSS